MREDGEGEDGKMRSKFISFRKKVNYQKREKILVGFMDR